jgi:hypothetical protein
MMRAETVNGTGPEIYMLLTSLDSSPVYRYRLQR